MIDIVREIEAVQREVGSGRIAAGEGRAIRLGRTYDAPIEDVWDALTNPERIGRWFLPISGDYRVGGRYQLEGNAGGEILACERPHRLRVTWVYGEVGQRCRRLRARGAAHIGRRTDRRRSSSSTPRSCPTSRGASTGRARSASAGTGACSGCRSTCGASPSRIPIAWQLSDEGREFAARSSAAWGAANVAAGADPVAAASGVANTTAFYAPDPDAPS